MTFRQTLTPAVLGLTVFVTTASHVNAQAGAETFTGTAAIKTAGGATATSPLTITIDRKMSPKEADSMLAAFKAGGAAALRKALVGVPPTGSIDLGGGAPVTARLSAERTTDKGRLLTLVCDKPILHLGAGVPEAKPKEGYDFAVLDIEVDAAGKGSGTLAPAAKVTVKEGAFVVEDYGSELVRVTGVQKKK
jgi:hypothetical protein